MIKKRWVQVGLVAAAFLVINLGARTVSALTKEPNTAHLDTIGLAGSGLVVLLMIGAGAWWAVRYPFQRLFFDLGAAALVASLLALIVGPFIGGGAPFDGGLGQFVGGYLGLLAIAALGVFLGFVAMVVLGKDWRSRSLRAYEQNYRKRPNRAVRG